MSCSSHLCRHPVPYFKSHRSTRFSGENIYTDHNQERSLIRFMRIILRMLRNPPILDALVSKTKQQILTATLLQPHRSWYLLELARHLDLRPSSLQRELKQLAEAGILKRQQNGNRVYFQADFSCPVFPELAQLLFKTVGFVDALRNAFEPLRSQIELAFVYGSVAASAERSSSDIDLMVVGTVSLSRMASLLRDLERQVGRPINPTVYSREEFTKRLKSENHFLKSVLREKPLFIIGGRDELAELTSGAKNKTSPNKPPGTRRPARRR